MDRVTVSYAEWHGTLSAMGWVSPYPESLWQQLGGADQVSVGPGEIASLVSGLGWSAQHADQLWRSLQSAGSSSTTPPAAPPVAPSPMPWEKQDESPSTSGKPAQRSAKSSSLKFDKLSLRRLLAAGVDLAVWAVALFAVSTLGKLSLSSAAGLASPQGGLPAFLLCFLSVSAIMSLYFSWTMRRSSHSGQSLGKQLFKLRVESASGGPLSPSRLLLRQSVGVVLLPWGAFCIFNLLLWPLGFLPVAILCLMAMLNRSLEDRIAQSQVVSA